MIIEEDDYLAHYGTPRHSGRYPWGSGGNEGTPRNPSFLDLEADLRKQGLTEKERAEALGCSSTTQLRARKTIELHRQRQDNIVRAHELKYKKGMSGVAAAAAMGVPETTFRSFLDPSVKDRNDILVNTAAMLKTHVDEAWKTKSPIDVGSGVESYVPIGDGLESKGISQQKLSAAVAILEEEGYRVHQFKSPQVGTTFDTNNKVLVPPGVTQKEAWEQRFNIKQIQAFTSDGGRQWGLTNHPPIPVSPRRVMIRYGDEGGAEADGVIYVREGAKDLTLGKNRYAQVRIQVGKGHYLKGMAVYKDNLPDGVDLVFNTNKKNTGNKLDAMKEIEEDTDYPFGSVVRQIVKNEGQPNEKNVSAMNLVNEQGDWHKWAESLSSQMLSKQSPKLAKEQLDVTFEREQKEFEDIMELTNPTVKKVLLEKFADKADAAAVHLRAAALPRSNWHAILPLDTLGKREIYAPNYNNGEEVVLVRYPHGGTFEIPRLTVNNRNPEGQKLIGGEAIDAVGINHSTAQVLSGADFDGDTVLVIPNNSNKFIATDPLDGLKDFDPQIYKIPKDKDGNLVIPKITVDKKNQEMGNVSNLITDMTLKLAPHDHLVRAIRHSMVVIDSEKHGLDWQLSKKRNGIAALKAEYQEGANRGASTLISRKKSEIRKFPDFKDRPQSEGGPVDRVTGRKVTVPTGKKRRNKAGELVPKTRKVNKLAIAEDAHTLSSGTPMEVLYANHSNKLKNLANTARLEALNTPLLQRSPSAARIYKNEVDSLKAKLSLVISNRPRERKAQAIANTITRAHFAEHPNLEESSRKKIRGRELERARAVVGVRSKKIKFTPEEWNAVQAGAVSDNVLSQILKKADIENVRELATPRRQVLMTASKTALARSLLAQGATRAEVAQRLGVSLSTLDASTSGEEE